MGGRANPLRDAAAIVGIGQTEFAKQIDRPEGPPAAAAVVAARSEASVRGFNLVTEGVPTRAIVLRAA